VKRLLAVAALLTLSACTSSPAPSSPAPASAGASTAKAVTDLNLCTDAKKASESLKDEMISRVKDKGDEPDAVAKEFYPEIAARLRNLAATGDGGEVSTLMTRLSEQMAAAGKAKDPIETGNNPTMIKISEQLSAACKKVGVEATF
jgi:hypothetical protein